MLPVNYRTTGFVLMSEDLSFPFFALHLYLLARAARVRTATSFLGAALALVVALSSWHAMGFVVTLEVLSFFLWFLRTGQNPFAMPRTWLVPVTVAAASFAVPVLRSKLFVLSAPMLLALAMLGAARLDRRGDGSPVKRAGAALGILAVLVPISLGLSHRIGGGLFDYGHVFSLIFAKIRNLGVLPEDPSELSFSARLLWQGPFVTASLQDFTLGLTAGLPILAAALAVSLRGWIRGKGGDRTLLFLTGFALLCGVSGWLVSRMLILPGFVTPVLGAVLADRLRDRRLAVALFVALTAGQAAFYSRWTESFRIFWYINPLYNAEIAHLVRWAKDSLPPEEAVAGDFVHSTALLAHNRNPIICQPKYETLESRRRFEQFLTSYFNGAPRDLARFARSYRCRYVLIDRVGLWLANRYIAGIPGSQPFPTPGTAAAVFSSTDTEVLTRVPGFKLVYRSPQELGTDIFRVYELEGDGG